MLDKQTALSQTPFLLQFSTYLLGKESLFNVIIFL